MTDEQKDLTQGADEALPGSDKEVERASFASFTDARADGNHSQNISLLMDVELSVRVEIGQARRKLRDILDFVPGSVVELDKTAGEPIDIYVNNQLMAVGEVVVIEEKFGVRIMEIVDPAERLKRLDE